MLRSAVGSVLKMWNLSSMEIVLSVLSGLITMLYWYFHRQFTFWSRKGVPFDKPHPIYGSFERLMTCKTTNAGQFHEVYNKHKGKLVVGMWEFCVPRLLVRDLELLRCILVEDFENWTSRGLPVNEAADPMSGHIVNLSGRRWKIIRSKLSPTFTPNRMKLMFQQISACVVDFENCLMAAAESEELVEAREICARFTTDTIGSCFFGIETNSLHKEDAEFREFGRKVLSSSRSKSFRRGIQSMFPKLFKILQLRMYSEELTDFIVRMVGETMDYRDENDIRRNDFIDLLRELKDTSKRAGDANEVEFDVKLLAAQALAFFVAGFETTSATISYCLFELAVNREIQQRLREEIQLSLANNNGEITYHALKDMEYLDKVLDETLRKYPPIPVLSRACRASYTLPGTDIQLPAGMKVYIPIHSIHHDPDLFPDPEKFDPERFSSEAESQRHPFAYIPFGGGPRYCIGQKFGVLQAKLGLAMLVEKFEVSLCEKSQNPLQFRKMTNLLVPEKGIWLRFSKN